MNGESAFGWLKVAVLLTAAFAIYYMLSKVKDFFTIGAGYNNPAKQAGDAVASVVTGKPNTLGGAIFDALHPDIEKKISDLSKPATPVTLPHLVPDNYVGDFAPENYNVDTAANQDTLNAQLPFMVGA